MAGPRIAEILRTIGGGRPPRYGMPKHPIPNLDREAFSHELAYAAYVSGLIEEADVVRIAAELEPLPPHQQLQQIMLYGKLNDEVLDQAIGHAQYQSAWRDRQNRPRGGGSGFFKKDY